MATPFGLTNLSNTLKDGRVVHGQYGTHEGMVTVLTPHGKKTTQLGGSSAESLARLMLRELADEGKA
jgi:hypothetical protein